MARYAMDEALRAAMLAVPGVSAILGSRLFPDVAPQSLPGGPYGVMTMTGDAERAQRLNGSAMKTVVGRYEVSFFATTRASVKDLAALVTARSDAGGIDGFRGTMGTGGTSAFVQRCRIENRQDGSIDPPSGGEARAYFASFDVVVVFNE